MFSFRLIIENINKSGNNMINIVLKGKNQHLQIL